MLGIDIQETLEGVATRLDRIELRLMLIMQHMHIYPEGTDEENAVEKDYNSEAR